MVSDIEVRWNPVNKMLIFSIANNLGGGFGTQLGTAGRVFLTPIWIPFACNVTTIYFRLQTASAGQTHRIGLYSDLGINDPAGGSLLFDSGDQSSAVAGAKTNLCNLNLAKGLYWIALETSDAVQAFSRATNTVIFNDTGTEKLIGCHYDQAYGALADPCPATTINSLAEIMSCLRVDHWNFGL